LIRHRGKADDKGGNPGAGARGAGTGHGSGGLGAGGEGDPGGDHGVAVGVRDDVHGAVPDPEHPDPAANPPPRIRLGERRGTDCPLPRPTAGGAIQHMPLKSYKLGETKAVGWAEYVVPRSPPGPPCVPSSMMQCYSGTSHARPRGTGARPMPTTVGRGTVGGRK